MQQSNFYILAYTAGLTIICGLLLAVTATGLKPRQDENIALEQKRNILASVMTLKETDDVKAIYEKRVKSYVVDFEGEVKEGVKAESVVAADEYKKPKEDRLYPVYEIVSETNPNKAEFYVFPVYGFGLWDNIWGFVALQEDMNTIKGVKFEHKGETPGLGARIATEEIQARYVGKKIFEGNEIVSVAMQKGEGQDYSNNPHQVDGMSGATITGKGVNKMLLEYFGGYYNFIKSKTNKVSLNQ
ncbi:NADH:ubiquinone reductase (Na(+)-transporting) subunit C [Rhodoflexus caldus]|uniref:NADH:ubiquinone reductase (Na(+)-transporting) subunit C n=1 Tax=Rhodoflexus caldus TaxID=2891236 RepID=UPI00202A7BDE|nr:NADH:ubiquinone reductase (Na(+)-transporting) subunit C [Rhodoflexus caldus]